MDRDERQRVRAERYRTLSLKAAQRHIMPILRKLSISDRMKVFKVRFRIYTFIIVIKRGITIYCSKKIIKKYNDLMFRVSPFRGFREARLMLGKGYEMRILQNPNTNLHDAAITHNGVLDLKNGVIDKMRMSITCDEVEKLMIKAQRKEWK